MFSNQVHTIEKINIKIKFKIKAKQKKKDLYNECV